MSREMGDPVNIDADPEDALRILLETQPEQPEEADENEEDEDE